MADLSFNDYLKRMGGVPAGSNAEAYPEKYIPQGRTVSEYNDIYGDPGQVSAFSPTRVQMNTSPMEKKFALETLLHEGVHTTQGYLPHILNSETRKLRDIPYNGYLDRNKDNAPTRDIDEVLASLKAQEGMLPKGKSVLDSGFGKQYVDRVAYTNGMKQPEARAYVQNAMDRQHSTFKEWLAKYMSK